MARRIPFQINIKQRKGYLFVECGGTGLTLESLIDMIHLVAQAVRTQNANRVLLVRNFPLLTSDDDRRLIASIVTRLAPNDMKFALVDKYGNAAGESSRVLHVIRAAGWNVTEFATVNEAAAWLTATA